MKTVTKTYNLYTYDELDDKAKEKAFAFIRAMKEREISWDKISHNKTIHLGHFAIDQIDLHGNVKAGCHFVEWDEIERMATLLKIYP